MVTQYRTHQVQVRLNDSELAALDRACREAGLRRGDFLRQSIAQSAGIVPPAAQAGAERETVDGWLILGAVPPPNPIQ